MEGDVFKTVIPLISETSDQATMQVTMQAGDQADEEIKRILEFCRIPRRRSEIQDFLNLKNRDYFRKEILNPLIKGGLLYPTIPDKPTSPNQKYYSEGR